MLSLTNLSDTKKIRRFLLICLLFINFPVFSQRMAVESFELDVNDLTANTEPNIRRDANGEKAALIKIQTTEKGFIFDTGMLGIVANEPQNEQHPAEIWLYVPEKVNSLTIQHPQLGVINNYDLGQRVQKAKTYILKLTSDQINTTRIDPDHSTILNISVEPAEADVYINGIKQPLNSLGKASQEFNYGTYNYRASAENYHTDENQFTIDDTNNRLAIKLSPAFGYLNVYGDANSNGALLFIDDKKAGLLPLSNYPLKSGKHMLTIHQKLFAPYNQEIVMTDTANIMIRPVLEPNSAEYEIVVDGDKEALIYVDGEQMGIGRWKGLLEAGEHIVEAKKISHSAKSEKINVEKDIPRKVSLSRPTPIYGSLELTTEPSNARVYIDGEARPSGTTDYINNHLLIGSHHIRLELENHKPLDFDVDIREGETARIKKELTDIANIYIYSNPSDLNLYIDNKRVGTTPYHFINEAGEYEIQLHHYGYNDFKKTYHFDANSTSIEIKLKRNYIRRNEFYFQAGVSFPKMLAMNFGMGFYVGNVNLEANYLMGLKSSEPIYWQGYNDRPYSVKYKPWGIDAKIGYGIRVHSRIRITPQIGFQMVKLKEKEDEDNYSSYYTPTADEAGAYSLTGGVRFTVALSPTISFILTPQYNYKIAQTDGFEKLSKVSNKINDYANGFVCNASFNLYF